MTVATRPAPVKRAPKPSTFAAKVTMAVTGIIFAIFVAIHMYGNLKAYVSPEAYNTYSAWLREAFYPFIPKGGVLWIMRVVLFTSLILHVGASAILWWRGRKFRGPHRRRNYRAIGARTMPWTGVLILVFLVFHILDLTLGIFGADGYQHATATESFAYQNTIASFQRPLSGALYLVTMLAIALHLIQGLWSTTSDLGVTGRRTRAIWLIAGYLIAIAIALGNASLPIAVWLGVLQ